MKKPTIQIDKNNSNGPISTKWSKAPKNDCHKSVFAALNAMESNHAHKAMDNAKYLALYENLDSNIPGMPNATSNRFTSKISFNVIKSCIDSVASEIAKNKPKPEFNTENGDYRLQKRAELLTQYAEGVFYDNKAYELGPDVFTDGCLWGTGVIAVINDGERIKYERVLPDEIYVDEFEGIYRKPKQLFHVRRVFRDTLIERFQGNKAALQAIESAHSADLLGIDSLSDQLLVVEGWHLPHKTTDKDGKKGVAGGRYVVAIQNFTLSDDEYEKDYFPFAFFRWNNKRTGFFGQGLAEELVPIQLEIARTLQHIQRNMRFTGLRIFLEAGSQINHNHLNDTGAKGVPVTEYSGQPPVVATWAATSQETYAYLENLYRKAFEISGVSQMMAFANKPSGITAARALDTLNENQSKRFMLVSDRYEQFFLQLAEITIDLSRDLYGSNRGLSVSTLSNGFLKQIKWKDVDLDNDKFTMQVFPVSAFSSSPAARLQEVSEAMQAGFLSRSRSMQLLEFVPDLKEDIGLQTASLTRVRQALDNIKYSNDYTNPDIYLDLNEAVKVAQSEINRSMTQGVEEEKLQLMRQYIDDCHELQGLGQPPPAEAAPTADPMAAVAQPMAAPTSDMLPMQPQN